MSALFRSYLCGRKAAEWLINMNIGLYAQPTNPKCSCYRGLYRQNNIIDFCQNANKALVDTIDAFFLCSKEGIHTEYSPQNLYLSLSLYTLLKSEGWQGEIVLFSNQCLTDIPPNFSLIGYDICADSMYYSPLGDGFLESYNRNCLFFMKMNPYAFQNYRDRINENGLFDSYSVALNFSEYCNMINKIHEHAVESEENWRPFAIYARKGDGRTEVCPDRAD